MRREEKNLEKNIIKLYFISALGSTGFHLVVYTLFILSKGFTMEQFFLIESAYMIVNLLTEIPTGMFSDRFSRRYSLIISSVISIILTFFIIVSNNFLVVLIAMGIGGLAASFSSGTDVAILYDSLKSIKKEKEFKKITGKMSWYNALAGATGGIIAGFLAGYSLSYPWWLSWIISFPGLILTLTLVEPPLSRKSLNEESHKVHIIESVKHSFGKDAGFFVIYSSLTWLFFSLGFWLWQPYLKLIGLPLFYFGLFYAAERIISGYTSKNAEVLEKNIGMKISLILIPIILAIAFILESKFIFILGFLFIFLQSLSGGYFGPITSDYINSRIPSERRATILSIKNMMSSLLFALLSPIFGYIIDIYSLQTALLLMGSLLLILAIVYAFFVFKLNNHKNPSKRIKY